MSFHSLLSSGRGAIPPDTLLGANLKMWINGRSPTNKVLSGNVPNSKAINSFTSDDTNALAFTATSAFPAGRMIYQKKALYIRSGCIHKHASNSYFNFMHNGLSDWYYAERFMFLNPTNTDFYGLISNNAGISTNTGISITYDNRSASSRSNAIVVNMTKGVMSTPVLSASFNNAVGANAFYTIELEFIASTGVLTLYVNGSSVGTSSRTSAHVTSDATSEFYINSLSSSTAVIRTGLRKQIIIADRALTGVEKTSIRTFLAAGSENFGTSAHLNVYGGTGQSNQTGELHTPLPTGLSGPLNVRTFVGAVTRYPFLLEANVTSNMIGNHAIGPMVRMSEQLSNIAPVLALPYGVSGSPLYRDIAVDDWNVTSSQLATDFLNTIIPILRYDITYALDCTFTLRGITTMQGEADAGRVMAITGLTSASPGVITMASTSYIDVGTAIKFLTLNGNQQIGGIAINGQSATVVSKTGTTLTLDVNVTGGTPATSGDIGLCSWKADQTTLIKYIVDGLIAQGIDTTKLRWIIGRIHNHFVPARDMQNEVRADQDAMANFATDNPTYIPAKLKAVHVTDSDGYDMHTDTVHFTTTGNSEQGTDWAAIYDDYINE